MISDKKDIERKKSKEEIKRERELNDIRTVMGNKAGLRLIYRIISECQCFKVIHPKNNSGEEMYFKEGKRTIGLFLMDEIAQAGPNLYFTMLKENKKIEKEC